MNAPELKRITKNNGGVHRISLTESVSDVVVAATELFEVRLRIYVRATIKKLSKDLPLGTLVGLGAMPILLVIAAYGVALNLLMVAIQTNFPEASLPIASAIAHGCILTLSFLGCALLIGRIRRLVRKLTL